MRIGTKLLVIGLFCATFALGCKKSEPTEPVSTSDPPSVNPMATKKKPSPEAPPPLPPPPP